MEANKTKEIRMLQRRAQTYRGTALSVSTFEANLFGPQTRWSSLLGQREHLENEIHRGQKYLARLQKDLADCDALVQAWPAPARSSARNGRGAMAAKNGMVRSLLTWLNHLQERLGAVNREIEAQERENGAEACLPEESMFALLRAAG
jgi:hypothetical protein